MSAKEVEKADTPAADSSDSSGLLSGKITAILVLVYVVTIVLGGVIFSFIESPNEETVVTDSVAKVNQFLCKLSSFMFPMFVLFLLMKVDLYSHKSVKNP